MPNVIVTGASTGIGRAIALDLHRRGWSVLAGIRRDVDGADLLAAANSNEANSGSAAGGRLQPLRLDITNADQLAASTEIAAEFCGDAGLQVLINNAGIVVPGPLEFLPLDGFRKQLEVNTTGALAATQQFLPLLRLAAAEKPSHKPRILMVSSISGRVGTPMVGAYNASKFAMEGMSDALRRELLSHDIDVILIEPGAIATPIWRTTSIRAQRMEPDFPQRSSEVYAPFVQSLRNNLPKIEKRAIPAERVAEVVFTAVSKRRPKARYLIGTDAKLGAWLQRLLPTRWFDRLIVWDALRNT
jgi:NAD(P)-dependent dehydrogenase (short-subunit alcohol dehydrogenase family)